MDWDSFFNQYFCLLCNISLWEAVLRPFLPRFISFLNSLSRRVRGSVSNNYNLIYLFKRIDFLETNLDCFVSPAAAYINGRNKIDQNVWLVLKITRLNNLGKTGAVVSVDNEH
jgi:hypothetical protein